ncbi:RHS repeat-associated core domain-containing protein [Actinoplanes regularis]|uniref:RHS repeat-associated core domain-containing protein n=1 Tax=Actinoplanes regularis TaxID=52697 RepID=UPI0015C61CF7|nr:RHS repeat-associated core domain-containing protein [Actinoplanes regularis]GIE90529.1 type IV secretion protein Rhs [Actinoplanes regularis]
MHTPRFRRATASSLALVLTAGILQGVAEPAAAAPKSDGATPVSPGKPVKVGEFKTRAVPSIPKVSTKLPNGKWPRGGTAHVPVGNSPLEVGGIKIRISASAKKAGRPADGVTTESRVPSRAARVEVFDQARSRALGVDGVVLKVDAKQNSEQPQRLAMTVGYENVANMYGGDYGARLTLVRLPGCAEGGAACTERKSVTASNDAQAKTVTADVTAAAGDLFALEAEDSSSQGDYAATSLSPSSQWSVSANSGAFAWSYPFTVPPVPGGLKPTVTINYSSQAVDGRTSASNNQSSWIGEGFSYDPGYIERRYRPCSEDGHKDVSDLCYARNAVSISIAGQSGELVQDDESGEWRVAKDDGSKIEYLSDKSIANGDDNGEYWRVTSGDGTQYWFGRNRLPGWTDGKTETQSTWTVPVYGDDDKEPCKADTFADSVCDQAWRWNLDYVVDPHGNAMSFFYEKEKNAYALAGKTDVVGRAYDRGGYLKYIDYGQRAGAVYSAGLAPARVAFTPKERCIVSDAACAANKLTADTATNWPDTPFDRNCAVGTKCKKEQKSPSFWSRVRLQEVTTQIKASATTYEDVQKWTITHSFTDNGDGSYSLWPYQITHTGLAGDDITLPTTDLGPMLLANRIDDRGNKPDGFSPLVRPRLATIDTESGGHTFVDYADPDCSPTDVPAVGKSTRRCFPVKWNPPGYEEPITDWFYKYVVEETKVSDPTGGGDQMVVHYDYVGDAGWHYSAADGVTADKFRTWSDWRGYQHVKITSGDGAVMPARSDVFYLRGLDGDKNPDGGTYDVSVTDSTDKKYTDRDEYSGLLLETIVYDGADIVSKKITEPWAAEVATDQYATGTEKYTWGSLRAWVARTSVTRGYVATPEGWRTMRSTETFDPKAGRVTQFDDQGDTSIADDDRCTTTKYADNTEKWMRTYISEVVVVAAACGADYDPATRTVSATQTYYDQSTVLGELTGAGNTTRTDRLEEHTASGSKFMTASTAAFDDYGRVKAATDAEGKTTTTTYTTTNGLTTRIDTENALKQGTTWVRYAPQWGLPIEQVDLNGKTNVHAYDSLGRIIKVWLPDRRSTNSPSLVYTYVYSKDKASFVRTDKITNSGSYRSEYQIYDALMRTRQKQTVGPDGGRLVNDVFYNGSGAVRRSTDPYYTTGKPDGVLLDENTIRTGDTDGATNVVYDGANRVTAEIFTVAGDERWRTVTRHLGDRVEVDPPQGGTPTTTFQDVRGNTTEVRNYRNAARTNGYDRIRYEYSVQGQVTKVTDQAGNKYEHFYDLLGRQKRTIDPDAGTTEYRYDKMGRITWVKDGRGQRMTTTYDALGRRTATYEGDDDKGTKLLAWTWDRYYKGQLSYSQRFDGANAYSIIFPTRDDMYRPTVTRYSIPTSEDKLAGTYSFTTTYNPDGTVQANGMPAAGDLPAETVVSKYDDNQRRTTVTGTLGTGASIPYVTSTLYSYTGQVQKISMSMGTDTVAELTSKWERGTGRLKTATTKARRAGVLEESTSLSYTYDDSGNVLSLADAPATGQHDVQCFSYDLLGRLTDAWASGTTATNPCASTPEEGATFDGPAPYWQSYTYDAAGSRRTEILHAVSGGANIERTYRYPDANTDQPKTLASIDTKIGNVVTTQRFEYDDAGNTIARAGATAEQALTWNAEGRVAEINEGTKRTTFQYDADGGRILRKDPDATTLYLPGTELRLDAKTKAITGTRTLDLGSGAKAVRTVKGVNFMTDNHQGTAITTIDGQTGATERRYFTPFGAPRGTGTAGATSWPDEKSFVGGTADPSTGLVHLGAREYDPVIGRFISPDPIVDYTDPQQMHGYSYANNNPTTLTDPTGLRPDLPGDQGVKIMNQQAAIRANTTRGKNNTPAHDTATALRIRNLKLNEARFRAQNGNQPLRVSSDYADHMGGGADIICWNCKTGEVWVWEVKPDNYYGQTQGPKDVDKHIENVKSDPRAANKLVIRGPLGAFIPPTDFGEDMSSSRNVVEVNSYEAGVELYKVHRYENRKSVPREYKEAWEEAKEIVDDFWEDEKAGYPESTVEVRSLGAVKEQTNWWAVTGIVAGVVVVGTGVTACVLSVVCAATVGGAAVVTSVFVAEDWALAG